MAKLSDDKTYVIVEKGDTLSGIAKTYGNGATYQQLAAINGISNPNLIYIRQKIYLTKSGNSSSSTTPKKKTSSNKAQITHFGLQSNVDNTLFAVWKWDHTKNSTKHKSKPFTTTENYSYQWYYATGDGVWFVGTKSTTVDKQCTYNIPENATKVRFRVKPVSKTFKKNNKDTTYFTAEWTGYKEFYANQIPPTKPSSAPSIEIEQYKLTSELNNIDTDTAEIEFQIVKDDTTVFGTGKSAVVTRHAAYSCIVDAGSEYKVRCRALRDGLKSDWTDYSESKPTVPAASGGITSLKALTKTSVQIEWESVANAKNYEIQYTTKLMYFDSSQEVSSSTIDASVSNHAEITGLQSGEQYFFRVRSTNEQGESPWTEIKSITIGQPPIAPTTWSSTTTAITGEPLNLYWLHNAEDGSSQTYADLELTIGDNVETYTIDTTNDYESGIVKYTAPDDLEEREVVTSACAINTTGFIEGTKIQWRVRTAGITKEYGEWSIQRTVDVYAPPTLGLNVIYQNGDLVETLETFPFYIKGVAGPNSQTPIGYYLNITSDEYYETVDNFGNDKIINEGESVYSKYFDTNEPLTVEMNASNIDLENDITYTITCTVSMNSGLTVDSSVKFTVSWADIQYEPDAEISIDEDAITAHIRPYCEDIATSYYKVERSAGRYVVTADEIDSVYGTEVKNVTTTTGEQVYSGTTADGENIYYCVIETATLTEGVTLSVYRREFDGSFTEIATGLNNNNYTTVTDPHPSLDYARYRIVATDNDTGSVGFYDVPGYPVGEKAVIIQWNEEWTSFDTTNEDALEKPSWSGSLLRLPYNIDVSEKNSNDVSLIKYVGRKHPVAYYGTQQDETPTWNVVIPKEDKDTLYALRRLAKWPGDVYVREPSGCGYWANITVSFNQKHRDPTIPVTIDIVRVEGGV